MTCTDKSTFHSWKQTKNKLQQAAATLSPCDPVSAAAHWELRRQLARSSGAGLGLNLSLECLATRLALEHAFLGASTPPPPPPRHDAGLVGGSTELDQAEHQGPLASSRPGYKGGVGVSNPLATLFLEEEVKAEPAPGGPARIWFGMGHHGDHDDAGVDHDAAEDGEQERDVAILGRSKGRHGKRTNSGNSSSSQERRRKSRKEKKRRRSGKEKGGKRRKRSSKHSKRKRKRRKYSSSSATESSSLSGEDESSSSSGGLLPLDDPGTCAYAGPAAAATDDYSGGGGDSHTSGGRQGNDALGQGPRWRVCLAGRPAATLTSADAVEALVSAALDAWCSWMEAQRR